MGLSAGAYAVNDVHSDVLARRGVVERLGVVAALLAAAGERAERAQRQRRGVLDGLGAAGGCGGVNDVLRRDELAVAVARAAAAAAAEEAQRLLDRECGVLRLLLLARLALANGGDERLVLRDSPVERRGVAELGLLDDALQLLW